MTRRCRWIEDKTIGLWHMPECWEGVVTNGEGCHCPPADDEEQSLEDRVAALEQRLARLEASRSS